MAQLNAVTEKFTFGSGIVYVGDSLGAMTSLGAGNGIKFEETYDTITMKIDNAGEVNLGIKNHKANISCDLFEMDFEKFASIRGGIDNYTTIAGTLVSGAEHVVASGDWEYDKFIELEHQNGDGSEPTINSVTGGSDGAGAADDYDVAQVNGKWGIIPRDGTNFTTESQTLTIDYDYTPAATKKFTSGGKVTIDSKIVQIVHTTSAGKTITVTLYKAKNTNGLTLEFPGDDADEAMSTSFVFTGEVDSDRAIGDQLYSIEDTRVY